MTDPAPILLFCYKRLDTLKKTISALQKNRLATESKLYIFSDGPKNPEDAGQVQNIRAYLRTIRGFKTIDIIEAPSNKGLANSIIHGVTKIFDIHDRVIVLEDDILTSSNFLSFMNQALNFYEKRNILNISGFSFPITGLPDNGVYFTMRPSSWGWATWRDKWSGVDWKIEDYDQFKCDRVRRKRFNEMGSDLAGMLDNQMKGKADSWAIKWCYHQFKLQSYTVYPVVSKVQNIGFGMEATHTNEHVSRYSTVFDQSDSTSFLFTEKIQLDAGVLKQITRHYSIRLRAYFKVLNLCTGALDKLRALSRRKKRFGLLSLDIGRE
jgi:hypothetical protein